MKKEIIFAILIGLVMGLFITFGFYHSRRTNEPNQAATIADAQDELGKVVENGKLSLFSPENESVQAKQSIRVAGSTVPNAPIVIFVNNTPHITQADETGNFSRELNLAPLANIITVHSIEATGETHSLTRTVVVYDQELSPSQEKEDEGTNTEDSKRNEVSSESQNN